jgi:hypothetical protein
VTLDLFQLRHRLLQVQAGGVLVQAGLKAEEPEPAKGRRVLPVQGGYGGRLGGRVDEEDANIGVQHDVGQPDVCRTSSLSRTMIKENSAADTIILSGTLLIELKLCIA